MSICSGHGDYLNSHCVCRCGWGTNNCSMSILTYIGDMYALRWVLVSLYGCVLVTSLRKVFSALRRNLGKQYQPQQTVLTRINLIFDVRLLILILISITSIFSILICIDPYCQYTLDNKEHSVYSIITMISSLLALTTLIRLFVVIHSRVDTSTKVILLWLDRFLTVGFSLFLSISISITLVSNVDIASILITAFFVMGMLYTSILNIASYIYVAKTLRHLTREKAGSIQQTASRLLTVINTVRYGSILLIALIVFNMITNPHNDDFLLTLVYNTTFQLCMLIMCIIIIVVIGKKDQDPRRISPTLVTVSVTAPRSPVTPNSMGVFL